MPLARSNLLISRQSSTGPICEPLRRILGWHSLDADTPKLKERRIRRNLSFPEWLRYRYAKENVDARRKQIYSELNQSTWQDNRAIFRGQTKLWLAPNKTIARDRAQYLPNFTGKGFNGQEIETYPVITERKCSVIIFALSQAANQHCMPYINKLINEFDLYQENLQMIRIMIQQDPLKAMLIRLAYRQQKMPFDWRINMIVKDPPIYKAMEACGLHNNLLGYVYVVDQDSKIRWAASGEPQNDEIEYCAKAVRTVLHD